MSVRLGMEDQLSVVSGQLSLTLQRIHMLSPELHRHRAQPAKDYD
jgi:hypothetical protein